MAQVYHWDRCAGMKIEGWWGSTASTRMTRSEGRLVWLVSREQLLVSKRRAICDSQMGLGVSSIHDVSIRNEWTYLATTCAESAGTA